MDTTDTYAVRGARTKTTGHYRRPGTRTLFCNRPAGAPNGQFATLHGWKMCTPCIKAHAAEQTEAATVAETHTTLAVATNAFEQGAAGLLAAEPIAGRYTLRVCEDSAVKCNRGQCRTTSTRAAGTLDEVRAAAAGFRHAWPADENGNPVEDAEQASAPHCTLHGQRCDHDPRQRHTYDATPAEQAAARAAYLLAEARAAADIEAQQAAALVTEAEATAGTWRGEWIGDRPTTAPTLFDVEPAAAEQGALFA